MEPVKTVLQPIRSGLKVLTRVIKDLQKMLDNIEDAHTTEKPKKGAKAKREKKAPARKSVAKKKPSKRT